MKKKWKCTEEMYAKMMQVAQKYYSSILGIFSTVVTTGIAN